NQVSTPLACRLEPGKDFGGEHAGGVRTLPVPTPTIVSIHQVAAAPIVIHAVAVSVTNICATCIETVASPEARRAWATSGDRTIAGIVTVHEFAAFPVLISPAIVTIIPSRKDVVSAVVTPSLATSLSECDGGRRAKDRRP